MCGMIQFQPDEIGLKDMAWAAFSIFLGVITVVAVSRNPVLWGTIPIALFAISGLNVTILCAPSKKFVYKFGPVGISLGATIGAVLGELPSFCNLQNRSVRIRSHARFKILTLFVVYVS